MIHRRTALTAAAAAVLATAALASPSSAAADDDYTFAVIGDVPYGDAQIAAFPGWIQQINADPDVRSVVHLGDIKNGSSVCSDSYFAMIRSVFDNVADPFVYTPGDNEWTDCHRANNGAYNPLERLAKVRNVFFDEPGTTLGQHPMKVASQADRGLPENVTYRVDDVTFAATNVTGSNNDLQPWTGIGESAPTAAQLKEEKARNAANIALLHQAFGAAKDHGDRAVVVMQQADMFDPTYTPSPNDISGFADYVQSLVDLSRGFPGEVYLLNGDSHAYNTDRPLAAGSPWLRTYGVRGSANNLTRVTVDGSSNNTDWLKVTLDAQATRGILSWQRVPYTS